MTTETEHKFISSKHHTSLILLSLGALVLIRILDTPEPDILSSIEAEAEYISFTVTDPDRAAFYLPPAKAAPLVGAGDPTVSGLFVAAMGSTIIYRRNGSGALTVEVDPPDPFPYGVAGTLERETEADTRQFTGRVGFQIDTAKNNSLPRLPIWGKMALGREFTPPARPFPPDARLLLKGKLTVSGVSGDSHGSVLYPITAVDLPLGARVESAALPNGSPGPIWWGTVTVNPDQSFLNVSAVSESRRIALYRPGKQDADRIEVSLTDKLTRDPRRLSLQLYIAAIVGFASALACMSEPLHELFAFINASWQRRRRKPPLAAIALATSLLACAPTYAQVVRLTVGDNTFGQGWLFWDTDSLCKVVTARHVIEANTGQLQASRVIDSRDAEHETGPAIVDSPDYDIAVLPVITGDPARVCSGGRLSTLGVERRLRAASRLVVDTTGWTDIRHVPARLTAASRDEAGGERFILRLDGPNDAAAEGWSGSIVLDAEGPIGIVQRLAPDTERDLIALRIDVVRRLMQTAPPRAASTNAAGPVIDLVAGRTVFSPGSNSRAARLLDGDRWQVSPVSGRIELTLTFPKPIDLQGATLDIRTVAANRVKGVGLETIGDLARPDSVGESIYQRRLGGDGPITLRVSPRTVRQIRLVIAVDGTGPVDLSALHIF